MVLILHVCIYLHVHGLFFHAVLSLSSCGPQASFTVDDCVCPGSTLRFNCTAVGAGITVWTGSAVPQGCQLNLQHTQFNDLIERGESRFCDDMSIVAKPLSVVGNCYNSQLNITSVGTDLNGRSIVCEHDMVGSTNNIGSYNIMLTTGKKERERRIVFLLNFLVLL